MTEDIDAFNKTAFEQLLVPFDQYGKELKTAINIMNESIRNVSQHYSFCNTIIDINKKVLITSYVKDDDDKYVKTTEECTVYPDSTNLQKWLIETIKKTTEYKPLNPRAIENMKKQGIEPKKQACDIMLFLITTSSTDIHIAIYSPTDFDITKFIHNSIGNHNVTIDDKYGYLQFPDDSPLKKKDEILQAFFTQLKELGIYTIDKQYEMIFEDE